MTDCGQVRTYRDRAEQLRLVGKSFVDPERRQAMDNLAAEYERMVSKSNRASAAWMTVQLAHKVVRAVRSEQLAQ